MAGRRRGQGEGSLYQRKDGRWAGVVTVGIDATGRRKRRYVYGNTQGEALAELQRLQADRLDGRLADPARLSLAEFLAAWLRDVARTKLRATTYANYEGMIRNHVLPHVGGVSLARLGPAHVQGLLATLEREGASGHVRQAVYTVLHRALGTGKGGAVRLGLLPRNPCEPVERPRVPRRELRVLSPDEARRLLAAARGDRLEALFVLAVTTGLRQGELLGLRWGDVDLRARTLSVQRTLVQVGRRPELAEPKTPRSRRRVDLPRLAVKALEAHREGVVPLPSALVFTDQAGGPVRKSNLIRRQYRALLHRAGLPMMRFHDLRHSAATLLLAEGVHPKIVQERLGHSAISVTLDVYSHVLEGMQREAADKLDVLLGRT